MHMKQMDHSVSARSEQLEKHGLAHRRECKVDRIADRQEDCLIWSVGKPSVVAELFSHTERKIAGQLPQV